MVIPWIKVGLLSLNATTSATLGGLVSYCLFKGENNKEAQDKAIEEVKLELAKAKEDFEKESSNIQKDDESKTEELKGRISKLEVVQSCLNRMQESYDKKVKELGWLIIFKYVRYGGEYCK